MSLQSYSSCSISTPIALYTLKLSLSVSDFALLQRVRNGKKELTPKRSQRLGTEEKSKTGRKAQRLITCTERKYYYTHIHSNMNRKCLH